MSEASVRNKMGMPPPGPKGGWIMGVSREVQRSSLGFMQELMSQYGDAVRFRFFLRWYGYLFTHPDHNKHILQDNNRNFTKEHPSFHMLRPLVGNGLLTNDGEPWRRQRRLIQPAFHQRRIANFGSIMTQAAQAALERWQPAIQNHTPLYIDKDMTRLTLQVVGQSLFSLDISGEADRVGAAFSYANQYISELSRKPFSLLLLRFPSAGNRRLFSAIHALDEVVYKIIAERRRSGIKPDDLLSMLISARDEESGEGMDDRQLRDEVMTLLLAGHETTSNLLSWAWYLLSRHPEVEAKLATELEQTLGGRPPTIEDLPNLSYTRMVLEETLRLYPPAYAIGRYALEADEIGGYTIPAGSSIMISPYLTHRHPDFWKDPDRFDPERFTSERSSERPRYAFIPFGGGPRKCIGNTFALTEAQLVLACIAQQVRLVLATDQSIEVEPLITLRPKGGIPMFVEPRKR